MTPFSSIATRVASKRVPSSGSSLADEGLTRERQGLGVGVLLEECECGGEFGWGFWSWLGERWRREKKSLMSWVSRLRVPFEVRREMRPSARVKVDR